MGAVNIYLDTVHTGTVKCVRYMDTVNITVTAALLTEVGIFSIRSRIMPAFEPYGVRQPHLEWTSSRFFRNTFLLLVAVLFLTAPGPRAQQNGHYLQGITGLDDGTALPPGFYVSYVPYLNLVNSFKGPDGKTLADTDLNIVVHNTVFEVTLPVKLLGAYYGFSATVPFVNTRLEGDSLAPSVQSAGLSDIYVAPIVLGWYEGKATYLVNFGFYAPTGSFNSAAAFNPGLGFWEQQLQAGATYNFDQKKLWNASLLSTWEFNDGKQRRNLKPGPMATFEYSFGRRLLHNSINVGAAGFAYQKLSEDTGSAVPPSVKGNLDRAFGLGPEFKYVNFKCHMAFDVRYEPEFGVQSRTRGNIVVVTLSYLQPFSPR